MEAGLAQSTAAARRLMEQGGPEPAAEPASAGPQEIAVWREMRVMEA